MHCLITNKSIIQVTGEDRQTFLQGQLTADIDKLNVGESSLACQCNAKGKTCAIYQVLTMQDRYLLVTDQGCLDKGLQDLKKYAVFSKVEITNVTNEYGISGVLSESLPKDILADSDAIQVPKEHFQSSIVKINESDIWLTKLTLPVPRFVMVYPKSSSLNTKLEQLPQMPLQEWQALDIQAGIPKLATDQSEEYVPQMMNMQALDAICFTKGCYMGQEVVARTKYLGKNKRAGCILVSDTEALIEPGDTLELQLGENWRRIGTCLYSGFASEMTEENSAKTGQTWAFAVLPNDLEKEAIIRLQKQPDVRFTLSALPYSLEEKS